MSTSDFRNYLKDHPVVVILGVLASLVTIFTPLINFSGHQSSAKEEEPPRILNQTNQPATRIQPPEILKEHNALALDNTTETKEQPTIQQSILTNITPRFINGSGPPEEDYIAIYDKIQQGDTLSEKGNLEESSKLYLEALAELLGFARQYPQWNSKIVVFREVYLQKRLADNSTRIAALRSTSTELFADSEVPENQYIKIYGLILQADIAAATRDLEGSKKQYTHALTGLRRFVILHPNWNTKLIESQESYLHAKVE